MKNSKNTSKTQAGRCIECAYGHFPDDPPLTGECRFNPPRAVYAKGDTAANRHFVSVRFDDWCGKYKQGTPETEERLAMLQPFLSEDQLYKDAKRFLLAEDVTSNLTLFEQLHSLGKLTPKDVHEIAQGIRKSKEALTKGFSAPDLFIEWQRRAADMDHPEACYYFALALVQDEYALYDETLSKQYLMKSADLGLTSAQQRVEDDKFFKIESALPQS